MLQSWMQKTGKQERQKADPVGQIFKDIQIKKKLYYIITLIDFIHHKKV